MRDPCRVQRFFHSAGHHVGRDPNVLEPERDLEIDGAVDGLELGVLEDEAHAACEVPGRSLDDVESEDLGATSNTATMKVWDEAVQHPQQRRLAPAGWTSHHGESVLKHSPNVTERGLCRARIPVIQVGYRPDRHNNTGAKRSTQAASGRGSIAGAPSVGYGSQSAAQPAMRETANSARARADAATKDQSDRCMRLGFAAVLGPDPKPRASMDSASWMDPSMVLSTTGTRISDQERGPRGRQPRSRCASVTWVNEVATAGTRLRDAVIAVPVRESAAGRASTTSCEASSSENGAADRMAAAMVIPAVKPKATASTVYGPPRAGIWGGSSKRTVAPRWADKKLSSVAKVAIRITAVSHPRMRRKPALAASELSVAASTRALYAGFDVERAMKRQVADQAATPRAFMVGLQPALANGGGEGFWSVACT